MDDSNVKVTSINKVLSQQAYILFYTREPRPQSVLVPSSVPVSMRSTSQNQALAPPPLAISFVANGSTIQNIEDGDSSSDDPVEEKKILSERKTRLRRMLSWCLLPMT
jgi:hypothetical protein